MEQLEYSETSGNHPKGKNTTFSTRPKFEIKKAKVVGTSTGEKCGLSLPLRYVHNYHVVVFCHLFTYVD